MREGVVLRGGTVGGLLALVFGLAAPGGPAPAQGGPGHAGQSALGPGVALTGPLGFTSNAPPSAPAPQPVPEQQSISGQAPAFSIGGWAVSVGAPVARPYGNSAYSDIDGQPQRSNIGALNWRRDGD